MTRFVMSIEESVRLVLDTAKVALGGEIFVTKMPVVKIIDLARAMIEIFAPAYGHQAGDIEIVNYRYKAWREVVRGIDE